MKALVEYLVKSLVSQPEAVVVTQRPGDVGQVVEIAVAKEDLGHIIGRKGKTIKSIRHVVQAAAARLKTKISIVIQE